MTRDAYIQEIIRVTDKVKEFGKAYFRGNYDEDCVQEAIYICLKKYEDYNGTCAVLTWFIRIYINLQKQCCWRKRHYDGSGLLPEVVVEPTYGSHDYKYIMSKIERMRPLQRDAIKRLIDGQKPRETAALMNRSPDSVKMYNCKARTELRRLINDKALLENHQPNESLAHNKRHTNPAA